MKDFTIFQRPNFLTIKANNYKPIQFLEISILDFGLNVTSADKKNYGQKLFDCDGIIGTITLEDDSYLIAITKSQKICTIMKKDIFKVTETTFVKFNNDLDNFNLEKNLDENQEINEESNIYESSNNFSNDINIIKNLKKVFNNGFYFSNKYDLANSLTSQNQIMTYFNKNLKLISDYDYITDGNKNYLSNWKLTDKITLVSRKIGKSFISNCIYGNIEQFYEESENIEIIMISRRYLWKFGNVLFRRGLSKYGGNSNQIETELILIYNNNEIYSNIQLSSYLPIYFSKKDINVCNKAFIKYMQTLIDEYNLLFCFLLKGEQNIKYFNKLKNMFTKNKISIEDRWKYFSVDTKKKNIGDTLQMILPKKDLVKFIGFNKIKDNFKFDKQLTQVGIFNLFSMDDGELTENQFILTYYIIYNILNNIYDGDSFFLKKKFEDKLYYTHSESFSKKESSESDKNVVREESNENIKLNNYNTENNLKPRKSLEVNKTLKIEDEMQKNNNSYSSFITKLRQLFINRNIELSAQYYVPDDNNENSKKCQRINEILFGKNMKYSDLQNNLNLLREEYSELYETTIFVGTWNVASSNIYKNEKLNLDSWLLPKNPKNIPDIYLIGLEEVVEFTASNVVFYGSDDGEILLEWEKPILKTISKIGNYKKLASMNLVGINIYLYVLEEKSENITNITKKIVKTGLGGGFGNKGSCCINFNYFNTSISVACSHLAAGNKNKQRLKELEYILNLKLSTFLTPNEYDEKIKKQEEEGSLVSIDDVMPLETEESTLSKNNTITNSVINNNTSENETKFKDSDIWIIFGDLNFRVDMDYEEFSTFIKEKKNWNKLLDYDQFNKYKIASLDTLQSIAEEEITFPPTYKYIKFSNDFDYTPKNKNKDNKTKKNNNDENNKSKSGKKRNPSWCDRVFYKKNSYVTRDGKIIIKGVEYNSVMDENFQSSDHRPIYCIFDVIAFKENQDKKDAIEDEIISNEKLGINNKYMKRKTFSY